MRIYIKIFNEKKIIFRSDDEFGVTLPSRKDLSKSFAQLSLPNVLEFSTKTVDKSEESSTSTSSLVVIARTQIKAYTQFGPLQVNLKKSSLSKILQSSKIIIIFFCHFLYLSLSAIFPPQGEPILEQDVSEDFDMKDLWQVFTKDSGRIYFSTANPEKSNWFRYVRPAHTR
jgi:hypothetical protein